MEIVRSICRPIAIRVLDRSILGNAMLPTSLAALNSKCRRILRANGALSDRNQVIQVGATAGSVARSIYPSVLIGALDRSILGDAILPIACVLLSKKQLGVLEAFRPWGNRRITTNVKTVVYGAAVSIHHVVVIVVVNRGIGEVLLSCVLHLRTMSASGLLSDREEVIPIWTVTKDNVRSMSGVVVNEVFHREVFGEVLLSSVPFFTFNHQRIELDI